MQDRTRAPAFDNIAPLHLGLEGCFGIEKRRLNILVLFCRGNLGQRLDRVIPRIQRDTGFPKVVPTAVDIGDPFLILQDRGAKDDPQTGVRFARRKSRVGIKQAHLVPGGRGTELQRLSDRESRYALDTLISRVEAWHKQGTHREVLTVTQPADGAYLLVRMQRENHPNLEEARRLLGWNGGGANSSGRGIANIDTQGDVHPDQFWQDIHLGNVKTTPFSTIWEEEHEPSAAQLQEIRSIGLMTPEARKKLITGKCSTCSWFHICGGGFRTRAAFANDDLWGSDPACYLTEEETQQAASIEA